MQYVEMVGIYWEDHTIILKVHCLTKNLKKLQRLVYIVTNGRWMIASFQFNHVSPVASGSSLSVVPFLWLSVRVQTFTRTQS